MGVEIILNQNDLYGVTEVNVGYLFEKVCIVNGRAPICDLDVPPPFKRSNHHEKVGRAITFIFIIDTCMLSWLHKLGRAHFANELFGLLVKANQGSLRIMGALINLQHIFHVRDKSRVLLRRYHPVLFDMGLQLVFFKARAIVLGLAEGTISRATTLLANNCNVQRA